ncbi:5'/3'-nucleotidase SurE [Frankia canadensis]|nr:5'/3'-nucleotidase SurE [Frankia canadensis]
MKPARLTVAAAAVLLGCVTGCGSGEDPAGPAPASTAPTATAPAGAAGPKAAATATARPVDTVLDVLVTSDDGVGSAGVDALAHALATLPGTTVRIVAPAANQSGTGDRSSGGQITHGDTTTATGQRATEVSGFPADAVAVALDDLGLRPDLVVAGIHEGQNLGPDLGTSGTVGAARAAARRGIPALAASAGLGDTYDYGPAVAQVLAWISAHRANLLATSAAGGQPASAVGGSAATQTVANLNVPNCFAGGAVRGVRELASEARVADPAATRTTQTCTATITSDDEVGAFNAGFATLTTVPARQPE